MEHMHHISSKVNRALSRIVKKYNETETAIASLEGRSPVLLPHVSCHTLRRTFCSRLCENEANVKLIQELMGHSDIQTTLNIYASLDESIKRKAFNTHDSNNIFNP